MKNGRMKITYTNPLTNKRTSISLHEGLVHCWIKATDHEKYSKALEALIIGVYSNEKLKKKLPEATFITLVEEVMFLDIAKKLS